MRARCTRSHWPVRPSPQQRPFRIRPWTLRVQADRPHGVLRAEGCSRRFSSSPDTLPAHWPVRLRTLNSRGRPAGPPSWTAVPPWTGAGWCGPEPDWPGWLGQSPWRRLESCWVGPHCLPVWGQAWCRPSKAPTGPTATSWWSERRSSLGLYGSLEPLLALGPPGAQLEGKIGHALFLRQVIG